MAANWCDPLKYPSVASMLQGAWSQADGALASPDSGASAANFVMNIGAGDQVLRRDVGNAVATQGAAVRFQIPRLSASGWGSGGLFLMSFADASGNISCSVNMNSDGTIVLVKQWDWNNAHGGGFGVQLQVSSAPCIVVGAKNHLEMKCTPAVSGACEVRVNGVTRINFSGDTTGFSNGTISQVLFAAPYSPTEIATVTYSDMHAWDTLSGDGPQDFVGNAAVTVQPLNADSSTAQWAFSNSTGPGYPLLSDENDATYIEADTVGLESDYGITALDSAITGIVYLMPQFRGIKIGAGDCNVATGMRSGGTLRQGADKIMTTGEAWNWSVIATDPATSGSPWTVSAANAADLTLVKTL
jgi:hypothetical protein